MNKPTISDNQSQFNKNESKKTVIKSANESNCSFEGNSLLVGFLVTFSNNDNGEYWLLYEGKKYIIGDSDECDVRLTEATVSKNHAILNIRRSANDNRLMFIVTDNSSANGVKINNIDIEYKPYECNNHDVIEIGNYKILIICIDKIGMNLCKTEAFKSSQLFDYSKRSLYNSDRTKIH